MGIVLRRIAFLLCVQSLLLSIAPSSAIAQLSCTRTGDVYLYASGVGNRQYDMYAGIAAHFSGSCPVQTAYPYDLCDTLDIIRPGVDGSLGTSDDVREQVSFSTPSYYEIAIVSSTRVVLNGVDVVMIDAGTDGAFGTADDTSQVLNNAPGANLRYSHDGVAIFDVGGVPNAHNIGYCNAQTDGITGSCDSGPIYTSVYPNAGTPCSLCFDTSQHRTGFVIPPYTGVIAAQYFNTYSSIQSDFAFDGSPFFNLLPPVTLGTANYYRVDDSWSGLAAVVEANTSLLPTLVVGSLTTNITFPLLTFMQFDPTNGEFMATAPRFDGTPNGTVVAGVIDGGTPYLRFSEGLGTLITNVPVSGEWFSTPRIYATRNSSGDLLISFKSNPSLSMVGYRCS